MSDSEELPQNPKPPSSSDGAFTYCCRCLRSCFSSSKNDKKKFAGVEYELVPTTGEGIIFNNLPEPEIQKRYSLPQTKAEVSVVLGPVGQDSGVGGRGGGVGGGARGKGEERGGEGGGKRKVVKQQPKKQRSFSVPTMPPGFTPILDFKSATLPSRSSLRTSRSDRNVYNYQGPPRSSPGRGSFPIKHERQASAPASISWRDTDSMTGSWQPSLTAIEDVEENEDETGLQRSERSSLRSTEGMAMHSRSGSPSLPPEVEFSLYYDIQCRTLMVHVQCARFLPNRAKKSGLNPIVLLYLLPNREDIFHSKMIENSTNPVFNQSFEFSGLMPDEIRRQTLVFRVFSHSAKGDLLGGLSVPLAEADLFGVMCRRIIDTDVEKLKMDTRGDILISLSYNPANQTLNGLLLKATNLQKQDIVGLADPYVKIWLLKKGRRNQKWKSTVKRNTLIPIYNEHFQFDLSDLNVKETTLEILMMDYDRFSRNDVVGVVYIGDQAVHDTGKQHWDHVMSQPNTSVSSWHTILPITMEIERTTRKKKVSRSISSRYTHDDDDI